MTGVFSSHAAKIEAMLGLTNALILQPQGLTEPTLWQQTQDTHDTLTEPEFKQWLDMGVEQGVFTRAGDKYKITAYGKEINAETQFEADMG